VSVLLAGFDGEAADRLTRALTDAGYEAVGVGVGLAPTLAAASRPQAVLVPTGAVGAAVREAIEGAAPGLRFFPILPGAEPPLEALVAGPPGEAEAPSGDAEAPEGTVEVETPPAPLPPRPEVLDPSACDEATVASPVPPPRPRAVGTSALGAKLAAQRAAKLQAVRFGDYLAVLEVKPSSPAYVVDERYEALRRAFAPTSWPVPLGARELAELVEILDGLRDAHLVLGDPTLRARYERALRQPTVRPSTHPHATRDVRTPRLPG